MVYAQNSNGLARGLLTAWNPSVADLQHFSFVLGMLLEGRIKGYSEGVKIMNCYAPFSGKKVFWEKVMECGILSEDNLIFGGDLNFTLARNEVWGSNTRLDELSNFLNQMILDFKMIDDHPWKLSPTWRNGRTVGRAIGK